MMYENVNDMFRDFIKKDYAEAGIEIVSWHQNKDGSFSIYFLIHRDGINSQGECHTSWPKILFWAVNMLSERFSVNNV